MKKEKNLNPWHLAGLCASLVVLQGTNTRGWSAEEVKEIRMEQKQEVELKGKDPDELHERWNDRAKIVAGRFNVETSLVISLRTKEMLGWGEIYHLLAIAQKSGQKIDTILSLRQGGMGWGKIAGKYNLNLGMINREVFAVKEKINEFEKGRKESRKVAMEQKKEERSEPSKTQARQPDQGQDGQKNQSESNVKTHKETPEHAFRAEGGGRNSLDRRSLELRGRNRTNIQIRK